MQFRGDQSYDELLAQLGYETDEELCDREDLHLNEQQTCDHDDDCVRRVDELLDECELAYDRQHFIIKR
jgi:hypothetical protein